MTTLNKYFDLAQIIRSIDENPRSSSAVGEYFFSKLNLHDNNYVNCTELASSYLKYCDFLLVLVENGTWSCHEESCPKKNVLVDIFQHDSADKVPIVDYYNYIKYWSQCDGLHHLKQESSLPVRIQQFSFAFPLGRQN